MANTQYPSWKLSCLTPGSVDLLSGSTFKVMLVSLTTGGVGNNYTFASTDQFLSAIPPGAIVVPGVALTGKTAQINNMGASLTAGPVVFPGSPQVGAQEGEALIFYNDTGNPATSQLVLYADTETGLPIAPNNANIIMNFSAAILNIA